MKTWGIIFSILLIVFSQSCKKEPSEKSPLLAKPSAITEIDIEKIKTQTGIQFKILKTETIGFMPIHKFYWVSIAEKPSQSKIKELASAIIKETIAKKPGVFHSYTIHFFLEAELAESIEKSKSYAQATFLPEGSWLQVGRVPIDDYKEYRLVCTIHEK